MRPGTESLQGAWAFAAAAEAARSGFAERVSRATSLEARLLDGLGCHPRRPRPCPSAGSAGDQRYSPFILSAAFPGLSGEVLARALSDAGRRRVDGLGLLLQLEARGPRVLRAMGLREELALSAIRVSTGD